MQTSVDDGWSRGDQVSVIGNISSANNSQLSQTLHASGELSKHALCSYNQPEPTHWSRELYLKQKKKKSLYLSLGSFWNKSLNPLKWSKKSPNLATKSATLKSFIFQIDTPHKCFLNFLIQHSNIRKSLSCSNGNLPHSDQIIRVASEESL